jgi:pseudouridine synthase
MAEERLQKILSRAGVTSRRKAEQLMLEGRVTVNGQTVTELGSKADPERDRIQVDGRRVGAPRRLLYLALNKPKNCVTTLDDPEGRPTVIEYLKGVRERVFPVGRLDFASEGLLVITNDGELANRMMSAASHLEKTYLVKVNGPLSAEQEAEFRAGIPLGGRRTAPAELRLVRRAENPWYEVRLIEGRKNQVRMMFKHFGRLVEKLKRVRIGFLELGALRPGEHRALTPAEVTRFRRILKIAGKEHGEHH